MRSLVYRLQDWLLMVAVILLILMMFDQIHTRSTLPSAPTASPYPVVEISGVMG